MFLFSCLLLELNWLTEIIEEIWQTLQTWMHIWGFWRSRSVGVSTIKMSLPFLVYPAADVHLNAEIVRQKSSSDFYFT